VLQDYVRFVTFDVFDEGVVSSRKMYRFFRRSDPSSETYPVNMIAD